MKRDSRFRDIFIMACLLLLVKVLDALPWEV
jgi:hypothetical protein